jgi:cell division topological specificity factor
MSGLIDRLSGRGRPSSAKTAKDRLVVVLRHDRSEISPALLDILRDEIIRVLSAHIDVDPSAVQVSLFSEGREQHLKADIPLPGATRRKRTL